MAAVQWDAVVVGLGAMGSATLWRLAERGVRALGVDRFAPPHDRGSSHGDSRIIRSAYFEDPAYVPLVGDAFTLWRGLEAQSGEHLLAMSGAAMIGPGGGELVGGSLRAAREHGLAHTLLDADAAAARMPQHVLRAGDVVLHEEAAGVLRPERCVAAMLGRAAELGATVQTWCEVQRIESRSEGVRVHLGGDGEPVDAHHVVVCAGPWLPRLLPDLPVPLRVERQVTAWFPVDDAAAFAPARFPPFIRELPGAHFVYGIPSLDGSTVKVAVHHEGEATDADAVRRDITDADLQPLRDFAARHMRGVTPQAVRATTCLYTNTPDEHFVIDRLPGDARIVVLSACSGHGFKFAPVMGEAAAAMVAGTATAYDLSRFTLRRFTA